MTAEEAQALRFQIETSKRGRGVAGTCRMHAFTDPGVATLSSDLRSKRAVQMNIVIIRAFVRLHDILVPNLGRLFFSRVSGLRRRNRVS
jgi:hypothetical protein